MSASTELTHRPSVLQALAEYYERLRNDPDVDVPEPGYSREKIHFELVLSLAGDVVALNNLQTFPDKGKKLQPKIMAVPRDKDRTSGIHAYVAWEKTFYLFGADQKGVTKRSLEAFDAFKRRQHEVLGEVDHPAVAAFLRFLDTWNPENAGALPHWEDEAAGANVVVRLDGEMQRLHDIPEVRTAWQNHLFAADKGDEGLCLITGRQAPIARTHPFTVRGVRGAQSSGAALVSFNAPAFTSYGKEQSHNAPVSEEAAFAYLTALNHLLASGGATSQRVQLGGAAAGARQASYGDRTPPPRKQLVVGDATTLFWSEKPTRTEGFMDAIFQGVVEKEDDPAHDPAAVAALRSLLNDFRAGREPETDGAENERGVPFYVLGLAPNAARLSVRFWHVSTAAAIRERLAQHLADLDIERRYKTDPEFPSMWRLLIETAALRKTENIPPNLGGEIMRAVITGASYPRSLVARILGRLRADKDVTTLRAALLKAYYVRSLRLGGSHPTISQAEVRMSLNASSTNPGYQLGRLFAVMEKAQRDALGQNLNASIKDRFFGAASATPASVFPRLIKLAQHHIAKAEYGYASDRLMGEIMEDMEAQPFPAHLSMDDQAMFTLGYYHQRNALYRKKDKATPETDTAPAGA